MHYDDGIWWIELKDPFMGIHFLNGYVAVCFKQSGVDETKVENISFKEAFEYLIKYARLKAFI